jgi:hypothetical protein
VAFRWKLVCAYFIDSTSFQAYGKENFDALRALGEHFEKKETGKVKEYNETVKRYAATLRI